MVIYLIKLYYNRIIVQNFLYAFIFYGLIHVFYVCFWESCLLVLFDSFAFVDTFIKLTYEMMSLLSKCFTYESLHGLILYSIFESDNRDDWIYFQFRNSVSTVHLFKVYERIFRDWILVLHCSTRAVRFVFYWRMN